jgi:hypothetical protein
LIFHGIDFFRLRGKKQKGPALSLRVAKSKKRQLPTSWQFRQGLFLEKIQAFEPVSF